MYVAVTILMLRCSYNKLEWMKTQQGIGALINIQELQYQLLIYRSTVGVW